MTLHEEIIDILESQGSNMTKKQIAAQVNIRKNYIKRDGSEVTDFQIHRRTKNYPQYFVCNGSSIGLVGWEGKNKNAPIQTVSETECCSEVPTVDGLSSDISNRFKDDDVTKSTFLKKNNFVEIGTIGELIKNGFPDNEKLDSSGVYAITTPSGYTFALLDDEKVKTNKNVVKPWGVQKLNNKWNDDTDIIYYGLAGNTKPRSLRSRLSDLIHHANGKTTDRGPHCGGEIIYHLNDWQNFKIWIFPTGNPPEPRELEIELLQRFLTLKGKLPFGNRKP